MCVLIFGGVVVVVCVVLVFGSTCQCSSSAAVQQTGTPLVPARTPTVLWGPDSGKAVGGPFGSDSRCTANMVAEQVVKNRWST